MYLGGWPTFACTIRTEAAPALLILQSWAPRTLPSCSGVTDGEAALDASQSRETRTGAGAAAVELEQLPALCRGRTRDGGGERRAEGRDEGPEDRLITRAKSRSVVPSFAKPAKLGQPQLLWCTQRWASPRVGNCQNRHLHSSAQRNGHDQCNGDASPTMALPLRGLNAQVTVGSFLCRFVGVQLRNEAAATLCLADWWVAHSSPLLA